VSGLKVVRFLAGSPSLAGELRDRWARALAGGHPGSPVRVAVCEPLDLPDFPSPRFAAVDLQWFPDLDGALAFPAPGGGPGEVRLVVEEVVGRGADYLAARWADGGERFKMMSYGRRDPALSPREFSERWRAHAGSLGGSVIPDEVRGQAYVQDHPVPVGGRASPLDAVNEVWFDRLDDLRRRRDWFAARTGTTGGGLMSPNGGGELFVRECPVSPAPAR
jgi:hypothetical protein